MSKVLVKWNMAHVMSVATGLPDASVVQFVPGANEFTAEKWALIKDHPEIKARMEADVVVPNVGKMKKLEVLAQKKVVAPTPGKNPEAPTDNGGSALSELNTEKSKKLIAETFNTPLLREWLESEARAGVKKAIESQMKKIEDERAAGDDTDSQE